MVARQPLSSQSSGGRRAAVVGRPVGHSFSPTLHRAAYAALGLHGWRYDTVEAGADELPALLTGLDDGWAGLSITMPLKQAVVPLLHDVSPLAAAVGVVNTVVVTPAERGEALDGHRATGVRLRGDNTDVAGMVAALREGGVAGVGRGCVLGAGATGASAVAALAELGCRTPTVAVRDAARSGALLAAARRLGVEPDLVPWGEVDDLLRSDVVIATVPVGAADALARLLPGRPATTGARATLLDVVYDPWPTELARTWAAAGGAVVDGLSMLLHQAAVQVELFTGRTAPLEAMRAAVAHRRPTWQVGTTSPL